MKIFFSTVVRGAPVNNAGELLRLNWEEKKIEARHPIFPENPAIDDPNPRGNSRGGRGVAILPDGRVLVASYHSLYLFSPDLKAREQISHPLFAGLHEVFLTERGTVWIASTAIDAALEIDYRTGKLLSQFWPREMPGIQKALGVEPLAIDKSTDNRLRFLDEQYIRHSSHLHLNAVVEWHGDVYALFHSFGAIANLSRDQIVIYNDTLKSAHNLYFREDGVVIVNNTRRRTVQFYDLAQGRLIREIVLTTFPQVQRLVTPAQKTLYLLKGIWRRLGARKLSNPWPYFIRGMAPVDGHLLIGLSPATVLKLDVATGELVDLFTYSHNLAYCVHGIAVQNGSQS